MAVRKKSEAIHLRVSPFSKALLEGLSNASGRTSTQIIEGSIIDESKKIFMLPDVMISDEFLEADGSLQLITALTSTHFSGEPVLTKLRTFYVAEDALSGRDKIIARTIVESTDRFSGETKIFSIADKIIRQEYLSTLPKLDMNEVSKHMPALERYAEFKEKNPTIKASYDDFLKMTSEE